MPDNPATSLPKGFTKVRLISERIYQTILQVRDRDRLILRSQFANYRWENEDVKGQIDAWITKVLGRDGETEVLLTNVMKLLNHFMNSSFFMSPSFLDLMREIKTIIEPQSKLINESPQNRLDDKGISILLLDAENLHLTQEIETFLAGVCTYPLQIKIAFANWRNLGRKDVEFHNRGYELIHVPAGKDSADVKMATVGSSIFIHYPNAEEVLVCSSDGVLTHLCNTLQTHGLNVYLVRQEGESIVVVNAKTGQTKRHAIGQAVKPISAVEFIERIKKLIEEQQCQTKQIWIKLSVLSAAYAKKYQIAVERSIETTFPKRSFKDIFTENTNYFALHQMSDNDEFYVTLFGKQIATSDCPQRSSASDRPSSIKTEIETKTISSAEQFQKVIEAIVQELTTRNSSTYIGISKVGASFHSKSGQPVTKVMQKLGLGKKYLQLLQSYKNLEVKKIDKEYQVRKLN